MKNSDPDFVDYFNTINPLKGLQSKLSIRVRKQIFGFMPLKPGMTFLEVGTTPNVEVVETNYFSQQAAAMGCEVSITSPEDCSTLAKQFNWRWIPFEDFLSNPIYARKFDMVMSSAVLEHVGETPQDKMGHLRQMDRVSKKYVCCTTPNRFHWMEVHTKIPLLHWLPKNTHRQLLRWLGMKKWAQGSHLDLLSLGEFKNCINTVFPSSSIHFQKIRLLGAVSNLFALVQKEP